MVTQGQESINLFHKMWKSFLENLLFHNLKIKCWTAGWLFLENLALTNSFLKTAKPCCSHLKSKSCKNSSENIQEPVPNNKHTSYLSFFDTSIISSLNIWHQNRVNRDTTDFATNRRKSIFYCPKHFIAFLKGFLLCWGWSSAGGDFDGGGAGRVWWCWCCDGGGGSTTTLPVVQHHHR